MGELDQLRSRQRIIATQATEAFVDLVLGAAARDAPLEEGTLRASGDRKTMHGLDGSVEVVGFFATPYAARQHEELDYRHPLAGHAKYLERPFNEAAPRYPRALQAALKGTIR